MKFQRYILFLVLTMVVLVPRLPGLASFVAVDEPAWLTRGGNFYYALAQRQFENTVYEYHPGVTTMWYTATGMLVYFPEYRGLGQGYFDVDKEKFDPFLLEHGKSPMHLLYLGRLFQVFTITFFVLVIFYLLSKLIGNARAFLVAAFVASAPYFLAHSRALSHEAMVGVFVLASILGMTVHLERERKWQYLFISAAGAALAQLTKSSAMAMFPVIALMLVLSVFSHARQQGLRSALLDHLKIFGYWSLGLIAVYFIVWPGMWVAPGKMLYEVYGNAFSYAFQGARLDVTQELEPSSFGLAAAGDTLRYFITNLIWRSTPLSWAGLLAAGIHLFRPAGDAFLLLLRKMSLYLFVTAVMFILLFSLAQGRNSPHYIMTSYLGMDMIAALGWCAFLGWLADAWKPDRLRTFVIGIVCLTALQLGSALPYYPYYYTYTNPLQTIMTGQALVSDYGEGFEQAAAYLAQKPGAEELQVFSFRGRGPFSYFFPGRTIILNPLFMEEPGMGSVLGRLEEADYIVINDALGPRTARTAYFVQALSVIEPEAVIEVRGAHTIRIYRVDDLPASFYQAIAE